MKKIELIEVITDRVELDGAFKVSTYGVGSRGVGYDMLSPVVDKWTKEHLGYIEVRAMSASWALIGHSHKELAHGANIYKGRNTHDYMKSISSYYTSGDALIELLNRLKKSELELILSNINNIFTIFNK